MQCPACYQRSLRARGVVGSCAWEGCTTNVRDPAQELCGWHRQYAEKVSQAQKSRRYCATEGCTTVLRLPNETFCGYCRYKIARRKTTKPKANPRAKKAMPAPAPPAEPWDPSALKHADTRPPKPGPRTEIEKDIGRVAPTDPKALWDAWRALCHHAPDDLADLAGALGITREALRQEAVA